MRRTINGQDRKWYLAEILAAVAVTCGLGAGATAKPATPVLGPVEVQEEVGQRVQQLTHGNKEYAKELEYRIQDTFGVTATCPDEFFSTQARNLDCVQGLQNLEIALTKLSPNAQKREMSICLLIELHKGQGISNTGGNCSGRTKWRRFDRSTRAPEQRRHAFEPD